MNVVSLLDRLRTSKLAGEQAAKESNYEPTVEDVRTFMKVLRHLQKRSEHEMASIVLGSDLMDVKITQVVDTTDNDSMTAFMDHTEATRTLSFNFPWFLLDLDESEISRDHNGIDGVDHFCSALLNWMNTIKLARS